MCKHETISKAKLIFLGRNKWGWKESYTGSTWEKKTQILLNNIKTWAAMQLQSEKDEQT